jgi:hypothetical protein
MLCKEIVASYFETQTKPINSLCWQNAELLNHKARGSYIYQWLLKGEHLLMKDVCPRAMTVKPHTAFTIFFSVSHQVTRD